MELTIEKFNVPKWCGPLIRGVTPLFRDKVEIGVNCFYT